MPVGGQEEVVVRRPVRAGPGEYLVRCGKQVGGEPDPVSGALLIGNEQAVEGRRHCVRRATPPDSYGGQGFGGVFAGYFLSDPCPFGPVLTIPQSVPEPVGSQRATRVAG